MPLTESRARKLFSIFEKEEVKLYIKNSSDERTISGRLYNDINIDD